MTSRHNNWLTKFTHVLLFLAFFTPVEASYIQPQPINWDVSHPERIELVTSLINDYKGILGASEKEAELVFKIIYCENRELDPTLQSRIKANGPNGRENSWGLSQIHLDSWDGISKADATDPHYSIRFILANVVAGKAYLWSCYKKIK